MQAITTKSGAEPRQCDIAIIGAGPAGLMSAQLIAAAGHKVTIYERMPSPARKLLMAGRGGLNLTHSEPFETFITRYGPARDWLEPALKAFDPGALRAWADALDQDTFIGSSGRVFPKAMKASPLLRAWLQRLNGLNVTLRLNHEWTGWADEHNLRFATPHNERCIIARPDALLLTLGGASWPRLGATGSWYKILQSHDIDLAPLQPVNCGFHVNWSDYFVDKFQGTPLKNIALRFNGQTQRGELLITARGLEGGSIYALSAPLRDAVSADGTATLLLDLCPAIPVDILQTRLSHRRGKTSLANHIRKRVGLSPPGIALLREGRVKPLPHDPQELAALIKACPVTVTATADLSRAISTTGGICHSALNQDYMIANRPGVFAAGEMLDWDAPTGGYLLQATFATAAAAAHGLLTWLENSPHQSRRATT